MSKSKKKPKVAVIGGGTGSFTVLRGLKKYKDLDLYAIISSADDGGSNKKFRDEFGLLPPSDFRQALVALAPEGADNDSLRKLMMYRFSKGVGLEGQTFGNILIAALTDVLNSQLAAFKEAGRILGIKGEVIPITTEDVRLMAEYENGDIKFGEHLIDEPEEFHDSEQRIKRLFLNRDATIHKRAKQVIENADWIILGPGDLYTSILANIVVGEAGKIVKRSKAKIVYIVNLMTKYGQTYAFTASDHLEEIKKYISRYPDYVLMNNAALPKTMIDKYRKEKNDFPVKDDLTNKKYEVIRADVISLEEVPKVKSDKLERSLIRHDSEKVAEVLYDLFNSN